LLYLFIVLSRDQAYQFDRYMPAIYPRATELLARDMAPEIRQGLQSFFIRVGVLNHILDANSLDS
jgi:brefeldin A-inhibited guanine nucleotide-exchange protein